MDAANHWHDKYQESMARIQDLEVSLSNMHLNASVFRVERDCFRKALEAIKAKLSVTDVPEDEWVRDLHGELFALAHYALERNA